MPGQFANATEAFAWAERFARIDRGDYDVRVHRLRRMRDLLRRLGEPHRDFDSIHVTGSKGKGSTAAYVAGIFAEAGRSVGLYGSPHVESYRERIQVLDDPRVETAICSAMQRLADSIGIDEQPDARTLPTTFELLTACAFCVFSSLHVDIAVIEVGIGGRIDATNLITPDASVITSIELEHTDLLGPTLRSIAAEKSGIIKRGHPVFIGALVEEARAVVERVAELRGASVVDAESVATVSAANVSRSGTSVVVERESGEPVRATLSALAAIQATNASVAVAVASRLLPSVSEETVARGLERVLLPGRAEFLRGAPSILLDAAHTPGSIASLEESVDAVEPDRQERIAVFGAVAGKAHEGMLRALARIVDAVVITRAGDFKPNDPEALAAIASRVGLRVDQSLSAAGALERAASRVGTGGLIVVTGSFYLVGRARTILRAQRDEHEGSGHIPGRTPQSGSRRHHGI